MSQSERYTEGKLSARVSFLVPPPRAFETSDRLPNQLIGDYKGIIHLVTYNMSESKQFWFGSLDLNMTMSQFDADVANAGLSPSHQGRMITPNDFLLQIALEDGRQGLAYFKAMRFGSDAQAQIMLIDVVGRSNLSNP